MENNRPKVGLAVILCKEGKVLLGKRKGSHGEGAWGFPGGHLEFGESIEDSARREVMEETGLQISNIKKSAFTNDVFSSQKHYVTLFIVADYQSGTLELKEPEKCENWNWFEWNNLPRPLFLPITNLLNENFNPFNIKFDQA